MTTNSPSAALSDAETRSDTRTRRLRRLKASQRRLVLYAVVIAAVLFAGVLTGTESPQQSAGSSVSETQDEQEPSSTPEASDDTSAVSAQKEQEDAEKALEVFVPSEDVPADSAVSFPVDI